MDKQASLGKIMVWSGTIVSVATGAFRIKPAIIKSEKKLLIVTAVGVVVALAGLIIFATSETGKNNIPFFKKDNK